MAVLAILQPDARAEARLSGALTGAHDLLLRPSWDSLERLLEGGEVDACLVDGDHPSREAASGRIADLRSRFPGVAIVVCVESDRAGGYFGLGGLGVVGIIVSEARPTKVRADVDAALSTARAQRVEQRLLDRIPAPGPAALAWAMEKAGPETSVQRLAAALGHTPRSLREALQAAGLPRPSRILLWGRLLVAGARLGDDGRKVEDVAFSLGYSTATSFQRAMKIHTGLTPAEVSQRGGMSIVLENILPPSGRAATGGASVSRSPWARVALLFAALMTSACASLGLGEGGVDRGAIDRVLDSPPMDQLHVGVLVTDANSGRTLYQRNAQKKFIPASNQKILVTATALSLLGPDHRFKTEVWPTGPSRGSFLDGDLVVMASGDPSFSGRFWPSGTAALEAIADSVRATGVEYIAGSTFVDVSAWDSTTIGPTWEYEDLRYAYGSTGGAFAIDEGEIEVVVRSGPAVGDPAMVEWSPIGTQDFVRSWIVTSAPDSADRIVPSYLPESRQLLLQGGIAVGTVDTLSIASRDPVRQATAVLANAFEHAGIEVEGGSRVQWTEGARPGGECHEAMLGGCGVTRPLATVESPPLSELIAGILEPSQNWMTEQLVRSMGARFGREGSWAEGVGVMEAYLVNEIGVDSLDVSARDGSGLSAYNLITPRAIVRILREMRSGPHAAEYRSAMAEPQEEGSTLERRLDGLEGRVFAKTGTISNVNSLSGYLVRENGQEVVFSILTNGSGLPSSRVRSAIDEVVRVLAR